MDHEGSVDTVEGTRLTHVDLAAAAFLCGGAEDHDSSADVVGEGGGRQPGTEAGRGDDVVAAAVADAGEGVVLTENGDRRTVGSSSRHKRGVEAVRAPLDLQAAALEHVAQQLRREPLLEEQLGVLVDAV